MQSIYDLVVSLVGTLPPEFTFVYSILTLLFSVLVITFLFQLFFIPLSFFRRH